MSSTGCQRLSPGDAHWIARNSAEALCAKRFQTMCTLLVYRALAVRNSGESPLSSDRKGGLNDRWIPWRWLTRLPLRIPWGHLRIPIIMINATLSAGPQSYDVIVRHELNCDDSGLVRSPCMLEFSPVAFLMEDIVMRYPGVQGSGKPPRKICYPAVQRKHRFGVMLYES